MLFKNIVLFSAIISNVVIAAFDLSSGDQITMRLNDAHQRSAYAIAFQELAARATRPENIMRRTVLNRALVYQFETMSRTLRPSKLLILHTIETEEKAIEAVKYYDTALAQIGEFIRLLDKRLNLLLSEDG